MAIRQRERCANRAGALALLLRKEIVMRVAKRKDDTDGRILRHANFGASRSVGTVSVENAGILRQRPRYLPLLAKYSTNLSSPCKTQFVCSQSNASKQPCAKSGNISPLSCKLWRFNRLGRAAATATWGYGLKTPLGFISRRGGRPKGRAARGSRRWRSRPRGSRRAGLRWSHGSRRPISWAGRNGRHCGRSSREGRRES